MLLPSPRTLSFLVLAGLVAAGLAVYLQVRSFDFVCYDDDMYVYENPHVTQSLSADGFKWAMTTTHTGYWHPLTWLSYMLDCSLFGPGPGAIHLTNVLLHLANALLLFVLLRWMTGALWPSAFVAAAFVLHPMHVESVAWVAERKDVLSTFFMLLTIAAYLASIRRRSRSWYVLSLFLYAMGLMAKPMLVTVPVILLLLDYWPLDRISNQGPGPGIRRTLLEKVPFIAMAGIVSVATFVAQRAVGTMSTTQIMPLLSRLTNAIVSYARYMGLMFWPHDMAMLYPLSSSRASLWQALAVLALLGAITAIVLRYGKTRKYLIVGWLWFLITLLPVIGIVQVGIQSMADRYTYIPYIGLFMVVAWAAKDLAGQRRVGQAAAGILACISLVAMGIAAHYQTGLWQNGITLFSHAIKVTNRNVLAYNNRGTTYIRLGQPEKAAADFREALAINPEYADACSNLGEIYGDSGRLEEALEMHVRACQLDPTDHKMHYNLGTTYVRLNRLQEAVTEFKVATELQPDSADAYMKLGTTYGQLGRWQDAAESLTRAAMLKADPDMLYNLGITLAHIGQWQEAAGAYRKAIELRPGFADAWHNLGIAYSNTHDLQQAVAACKEAIRLQPQLTDAYYTMAGAYAWMNSLQEAADAYTRFIAVRPSAAVWNNLGTVYAAMGDAKQAVLAFQKALELEPSNVQARQNLARAQAGSQHN
jgi:protein O-mannosyl-transferase